jgi:RNA polymerase sigma-70 factor (ECF subfamily)
VDGWPAACRPTRGARITTTARNRALERLRRESRGRDLLVEMAVLAAGDQEPGMPDETESVADDRLRLIFNCWHPALSTEPQVALTLRLLGACQPRGWHDRSWWPG